MWGDPHLKLRDTWFYTGAGEDYATTLWNGQKVKFFFYISVYEVGINIKNEWDNIILIVSLCGPVSWGWKFG